jgi:polysaccharide export outer membrane protein
MIKAYRSQLGLSGTALARTLALVLLAAGSATAQENQPSKYQQQNRAPQSGRPAAQPSADPNSPGVLVATDEDYRISPGDVIEIQVEDAPELSRVFQVNAAGSFQMPYLGRVTAQQKTTEEMAKLISDGLRGHYLKDPQVTVIVRQFNSQTFFVQGAVRSPGLYQITGKPSLLKLISLSGGLAENHGSSVFILREAKPNGSGETKGQASTAAAALPAQASEDETEEGGKYELIKVSLSGLYKGQLDQNIKVEPGDIVNIPPADVFFVAGEVRAPGSFQLKDGTTLRQAISLAQGTTFKAMANKGIIFREDPETSKRKEIPVDIGAVMAGKKEDVEILANDVIIVPNSRAKSVGAALLTAFGVNSARVPMRY